ncbi:hypothetical protein NDU88_005440 [Pleurodeles waltl]|uniref:Uncharacterized protein n=1 Tax=Pleurodeles waltl TaxID=8319 RepID=A0AAV7RMB7_PLEWA|nr:hypothetical protein NDU88_005440 [Pleurodeles waltl]
MLRTPTGTGVYIQQAIRRYFATTWQNVYTDRTRPQPGALKELLEGIQLSCLPPIRAEFLDARLYKDKIVLANRHLKSGMSLSSNGLPADQKYTDILADRLLEVGGLWWTLVAPMDYRQEKQKNAKVPVSPGGTVPLQATTLLGRGWLLGFCAQALPRGWPPSPRLLLPLLSRPPRLAAPLRFFLALNRSLLRLLLA